VSKPRPWFKSTIATDIIAGKIDAELTQIAQAVDVRVARLKARADSPEAMSEEIEAITRIVEAAFLETDSRAKARCLVECHGRVRKIKDKFDNLPKETDEATVESLESQLIAVASLLLEGFGMERNGSA
jgi:hypothetical protein